MRWLRPTVVLLIALAAPLLIAAPAGAVVTEVSGTSVGLQPRNESSVLAGELEIKNGKGEVVLNPNGEPFNEAETLGNPNGNPVLHNTNVYTIYWDPTNSYHKEWQRLVNTFLNNVGTNSGTLSNLFAVATQYTDRSNAPAGDALTFRGGYVDTDPYPNAGCVDPKPLEPGDAISCLTNAQVQEEMKTFIADHKLVAGMGTVFYLLTPPGLTVCLDSAATHCSDYSGSSAVGAESESYKHSFCSYHSDINPDGALDGDASTILYGMIPWTAGGRADGHLKQFDRKNASDCQDGGYDPSSKPGEKKEETKPESPAEKEAYAKMSEEEQKAYQRKRELEGPHPEEPNQVGVGEDGSYDLGLADLIINQVAVEQQNIVTDPLLDGWQDALHNEVTDECRNYFDIEKIGGSSAAVEETEAGTLSNQIIGANGYYLNLAFNFAGLKENSGVPCIPGVYLLPKFTTPTTVNAGDIVGFDGMESRVTLSNRVDFNANGQPQSNYATYSWNFGDGSPEVTGYAPGSPSLNSPATGPCEAPWISPCAGSTYHAYQYGGTYTVTLSITDVGGNKASITHQVTVIGPPAPGGSTPGETGSGGNASGGGITTAGGGGSTTTTTTGHAPTVLVFPPPVAAAAIVSRTLATATRKGLIVRYSVNEQVAGHFEVLLSRTVASHLGIGGPTAAGLPAGTAPQVQIARATLVTTKGGHSAIAIQFSKRTAARLRRLRKVTLTLLLAVRNASNHSPATTTVLTSTTLVA